MITGPEKLSIYNEPVPPRASILDAAMEMATNLQVPLDMSLNAILSAAATVCQGNLDVSFPDGATMPVSLLTITVADSGMGKTPCQRQAYLSITQFEKERIDIDHRRRERQKIDLKLWEMKSKSLEIAINNCIVNSNDSSDLEHKLRVHCDRKPKIYREKIITYDDVNAAALCYGLSENWPFAVISNSDAADAMRKHSTDQLTMFNKLLDGDPIQRDRLTAHSTRTDQARLTVSFSLQPKSMRSVISANDGFCRSSGFLPRALVSVNSSTTGNRTIANITTKPGNSLTKYHQRSSEILHQIVDEFDSGTIRRKTSRLSVAAADEWVNFSQYLEQESRNNGRYADVHDHAAKMGAIVLKISALLEFFETNSLTIELPQISRAIRWGYLYLENAQKLYQNDLDSFEMQQLCSQLCQWIANECNQLGVPHIARSRLTSRCPYVFRKSPRLLEEILEILVSRQEIQIFSKRNARFIRLTNIWHGASFPLSYASPHP